MEMLNVQIVRNPLPLVLWIFFSMQHDARHVYEYARARVCMCIRQKENERVLKGRPLQTEEVQTYKCLGTMSLERENRERDSHATEALLRTLDDRGRSKGHRYRPACDALRIVAGDVEGGQGAKSERDKQTREAWRGKGSRDGGVPKNDVCVGLPIDATTSSRVKFKTSHAHAVARLV